MNQIDNDNIKIEKVLNDIYNSKIGYLTTISIFNNKHTTTYEGKRFGEVLLVEGLIMPIYPPFKLSRLGKEVVEKYGGWHKYLELKANHDKKLKQDEEEINRLNSEIAILTKENLTLQNRQLRNYITYSIIGFLTGAFLTIILAYYFPNS